jgi:hypothetical protein
MNTAGKNDRWSDGRVLANWGQRRSRLLQKKNERIAFKPIVFKILEPEPRKLSHGGKLMYTNDGKVAFSSTKEGVLMDLVYGKQSIYGMSNEFDK